MNDFERQKKEDNLRAGVIMFLIILILSTCLLIAMLILVCLGGDILVPVFLLVTSTWISLVSGLALIVCNIEKKKLSNDNSTHIQSDTIMPNTAPQNVLDSQLADINRFVSELMSNDKVMTIIKSYALTQSIPLREIEIAVLPLNASNKPHSNMYGNDMQVKLQVKNIENMEETDYIKFVKNFDNSTLEKHRNEVVNAFEGRDYTNTNKMVFRSIQNLYLTLVRTNDIEYSSNKCKYYAFLYLIYRSKKELFYQQACDRLDYYDIDLQANDEEVIKKLYANDVEKGFIATTLWARKEHLNNYNCLICEEYTKIEENVEAVLQKIKDKALIDGLLNKQEQETKYSYTMSDIDLMTGDEFEWFVTYLFNQLGYKAERTKSSGDQGVDVIAQKGKTKIAIQAKHYSKPVGTHAVQEVVGGAKCYLADKTMVVTNNVFTKQAKDIAKANNVILWDRYILQEKLNEI